LGKPLATTRELSGVTLHGDPDCVGRPNQLAPSTRDNDRWNQEVGKICSMRATALFGTGNARDHRRCGLTPHLSIYLGRIGSPDVCAGELDVHPSRAPTTSEARRW